MASNYTDLQVVADVETRPGFVTFGVLFEGVFVPIAQQPLGLVEKTKRVAEGKEQPQVTSASDQQVAELQAQLDKSKAEQQALTRQLAALQTDTSPATPASPPDQAAAPASPATTEPGTPPQPE